MLPSTARALALSSSTLSLVLACALRASATPRPNAPQSGPRAAPMLRQTDTDVLAVSADRRTAVVRIRNLRDRNVLPRYRSVEIASQRVLQEWSLGARDGLETNVFFGRTRREGIAAMADAPAHRLDIARQSAAFASVSTNNDQRFAVGASRVAFVIGDDLWTSDRSGAGSRRVSTTPAAYGPIPSPDGQRVAFTGMIGRLDGVVGNYVLHFLDLRGRASPVAASSTRDVSYADLAWSPNGNYVYARMGSEHAEGGCLVRVVARPPFNVERLACVDRSERIDLVAYSPNRRWAVVHGAMVYQTGGARHSLQWVDLSTGQVTATARFAGISSAGAVSDRGVYVAQSGAQAMMLDPSARRLSTTTDNVSVPIAFHNAAWIDDDRYIVGNDGNVRVIDLRTVRWTAGSWPSV
ncbi:MAG: PD40 domain-containing protein [Myxococcales bacterium]|nr:PD40 domain-containing protein [Myxococcales bacterium]